MATSMIRQRSEYNVRSKQKLQTRALKTPKITRSQLLLYIHRRKQRHQVGHPRTSPPTVPYQLINLKRPARRAPALSPRSRIMSRTLTEKALGAMSTARRRLKRISVRGVSRQAVIHKTLRQGCALGSAASRRHSFWRPRAGAVEWSHSRASCSERMEHVIIVREGSVALRAGGCTVARVVALCPRGGRCEMADRTNEVELGAWRRGRGSSWTLLDDFGTFILRTFSAVHHYSPAPASAL